MNFFELGKRPDNEPKVEQAVLLVCENLQNSMNTFQVFEWGEKESEQFTKQLAFPVVKLVVHPESHPLSVIGPRVDYQQRMSQELVEKRLTPQIRRRLLQNYPIRRFFPEGYTLDDNRRQMALNRITELSFEQVLQALARESQRRTEKRTDIREDLVRTFRLQLIERITDSSKTGEPIKEVSGFPFPQVRATVDLAGPLKQLRLPPSI